MTHSAQVGRPSVPPPATPASGRPHTQTTYGSSNQDHPSECYTCTQCTELTHNGLDSLPGSDLSFPFCIF